MKMSESIVYTFGDDEIRQLVLKYESHHITQEELDKLRNHCIAKYESVKDAHETQRSNLYDLYHTYNIYANALPKNVEDIHNFVPVFVKGPYMKGVLDPRVTDSFTGQPATGYIQTIDLMLACSCGKLKTVESW